MKIRARYTGDHENFKAWGISFPVNKFVEVTDPHAIKKISDNSHFEIEAADPKKPADPKKADDAKKPADESK